MKKAALLIEDKDAALVVRTALECAGFACEMHAAMAPMLRSLRRDEHAAIVVDVSAPAVDSAAILGWRREWLGAEVALIAIGADDGQSAMRELDRGVDDFVAKPVRGAELLARLRAALRRGRLAPPPSSPGPSFAGCSVDRAASAIVSASTRVTLTARELALAQLLFENAGQLVTRAHLARDVWGQEADLTKRSIEQHVYQLRRKIKRCVGEALALRGVYGSGYRIEATAAAPSASRPPAAGFPRSAFGRRASDVARPSMAALAA